jgi:hypothetical protein
MALDPIISEDEGPTTLKSVICSYPNQTLWNDLDLDGDGEWIVDGLARGSLAIVHNSSFSAAERTDNHTASNYRGELLGNLMTALILKAASSLLSGDAHPAVVACDNMGVVIHGNDRHRSLREAQSQADLIRCFRGILAGLPFEIIYEHVYGHQDKNIPWNLLTLLQQLNTIADQLAKDALWRAFASGRFISSNFPFKSFRILINGRKVTSSIRDALYKSWGYEAAKDLFEQRKILSPSNFDLICWDAVSDAMLVYPRMFQVWVTKTVSHFCGSNLQLARFRESTTDACSCCGTPEESAAHITRGRNDGRTEMFDESVSLFIKWLSKTHMQEDLILCIERYLYSVVMNQWLM